MKKILSFLLLSIMIVFSAIAQDDENEIIKKDESGVYCYEEVVSANGVTQTELFKRAKSWILANMKTGDNNISFDENDLSSVNTGAIKIDKKHFVGTAAVQDGAFDFKFHVWCKEGRYKIRVDNIMAYLLIQDVGRKTLTYEETEKGKHGKYTRGQINTKLSNFVAQFKDAMTRSATEVQKKNDW